jgi:hypothetical protein
MSAGLSIAASAGFQCFQGEKWGNILKKAGSDKNIAETLSRLSVKLVKSIK